MYKSFVKLATAAAGAMFVMAAVSTSAQALDGWPSSSFTNRSSGQSGFSANSFFGNGGGSHRVNFPKKYGAGQIIVSFGDRRLYYITSKGKAISYPIAIPKGDARWSGVHRISSKKVNPRWTPTASMRRENPKLPAYVPGGHPRNPLGVRALYIGNTMYRIHGTDAPWLIGREVSHGCIRMHNSDVVDLYRRAPVGTTVTVTWNHFTTS